jgi:hypothetical protein
MPRGSGERELKFTVRYLHFLDFYLCRHQNNWREALRYGFVVLFPLGGRLTLWRCASRAYIASKRFLIPERESRLYRFSWMKRGLR